MQHKAAKVGFDWDDVSGALEKVREETAEVARAVAGDGDPSEELGDLLFAAVNVARFLKTDPEEAISRTTDKFIRRFAQVEQAARDAGKDLADMSLAEMDALWDAAKQKEHT